MYSITKTIIFLLFGVLVFLFTHFLNISFLIDKYYNYIFNNVNENRIYDFIIVGAGSAGSTIAARLTDAGKKVALLESGGSPPFFADIPVLSPMLQKSPYDWQYRTVAQKHACRGLINNASTWPAGKVLGGSSRLNIMAYVEGHPDDYEDWLSDYKTERAFKPNNLKWCSALGDALLAGASELSATNEYKNRLSGFTKVPVTMVDGERWSTDKLLTKERLKRGLDVITHARVDRVIFDRFNRARGVEFERGGKTHRIGADSGVIISAGAIGSPKLLMLSGIGPEAHLRDLNIDVINNLPVGQNLMDHILTGMDLVILNTTLSISTAAVLKPSSAIDYYLHREGPWTSTGLEIIGFLHTNSTTNMNKQPDIELMAMPIGVSQDNGISLRKLVGIRDEVYDGYFAALVDKTAVTLAPVLLHPKSVGEIKLRSKNPDDDPIIDPKYLSSEEDVITLIKGINFVEKLVNTVPMKKLGAEINKQPFPGCDGYKFGSQEYWECYIRQLTLTSYHPAGTCSIGKVVNKDFRVYNTQNLYVVDASVMPVLPSGNINAAVMMLANRAAKLLIESLSR